MTVQRDEEFELKARRRQGKFERINHLNHKKNTEKKVLHKEKRTVFDRSQKSTGRNYKELIETMLNNFKLMGCRISFKVLMLHANLFRDKLGANLEEHGKRFRQNVMKTSLNVFIGAIH